MFEPCSIAILNPKCQYQSFYLIYILPLFNPMLDKLISEANYDNKIIFCTGLTGFIGTNFYHRLGPKGIHFISLIPAKEPDHMNIFENVTFYNGRVEDVDLMQIILSTHRPHYIIHFASKSTVQSSFQEPLDAFETNVRGTWNIMEAVRLNPGRIRGILFSSTDKVYGEGLNNSYLETDCLRPESIYDISKTNADIIVRGYARNYGIPAIVLRFCNVYGPWDRSHTRIVPKTLTQIHNRTSPIVHYYLDKFNHKQYFKRSMIYVEDILDGIERAIGALERALYLGEVFNFGTNQSHTTKQIVETLMREMSFFDGYVEKEVGSGEIGVQLLSYEKANRCLGFKPTHTLDVGIRRTASWFIEQS
jgi:CDP-glucose 4,6-dehydratase